MVEVPGVVVRQEGLAGEKRSEHLTTPAAPAEMRGSQALGLQAASQMLDAVVDILTCGARRIMVERRQGRKAAVSASQTVYVMDMC